MGLPQLAPSTEIKRALLDNGADQRALFTILGESLAGPLGGVSSDVAAAAGHLADGNKLKAAAAMLPKGFAINDIARMLEYMNNGVKNTAGYQSLSPEQITTWGVIVRGLGFEPPIVADLKTKQRAYHRREAEAVEQRCGKSCSSTAPTHCGRSSARRWSARSGRGPRRRCSRAGSA
jgi:hypothetical protein